MLRRGVRWRWSSTEQAAFKRIKSRLTADAVLVHYEPYRPLILACYSSSYSIGAVLSQVMSDGTERPVCFVSRALMTAEQNYAQIEHEALSPV